MRVQIDARNLLGGSWVLITPLMCPLIAHLEDLEDLRGLSTVIIQVIDTLNLQVYSLNLTRSNCVVRLASAQSGGHTSTRQTAFWWRSPCESLGRKDLTGTTTLTFLCRRPRSRPAIAHVRAACECFPLPGSGANKGELITLKLARHPKSQILNP